MCEGEWEKEREGERLYTASKVQNYLLKIWHARENTDAERMGLRLQLLGHREEGDCWDERNQEHTTFGWIEGNEWRRWSRRNGSRDGHQSKMWVTILHNGAGI